MALLEKLNREDRIVSSLDDIETLFRKEIDYGNTNKIIKDEKARTYTYLMNNI